MVDVIKFVAQRNRRGKLRLVVAGVPTTTCCCPFCGYRWDMDVIVAENIGPTKRDGIPLVTLKIDCAECGSVPFHEIWMDPVVEAILEATP